MNITLGVPRIKEIINATKAIKTPIVTARLTGNHDEDTARIVKGRIEQTRLGEISSYVRSVIRPSGSFAEVQLDLELIENLCVSVFCGVLLWDVCPKPMVSFSFIELWI